MSNLVGAAVFWILYLVYRRRDRRLLRNGVFLVAAGWFTIIGLLNLLALWVPGFSLLIVALLLLLPLAVVVLAVFLIANGVIMLRRERASLANVLSLLAGLALVALPLVAGALLLSRRTAAVGAAAVLVLVCSYLGVVFVSFLVYSVAYGRMSSSTQPAALVVLGSQVIDGRVPPLLASRLDKALAVYQEERRAGRAPLLIPSGGQGPDETRSEGEAMAAYLVGHGADPADVLPETAARNTRENLVLSRAVQDAAGRPGPVLAVTNNYHVLRTAVLARQIDSDAQVIGAPTARYYVPSAFLREFVAVLAEHKRLHLALVLPFVALTASLFIVVALQR